MEKLDRIELLFRNEKARKFHAETPYHEEITKDQMESVRLTWFGGLGFGFKVGNHFELVPEVHYRQMVGSPYQAGFPIDMRLHYWDFRLGLTYYF